MRKDQAVALFGGVAATADAVGISYQAVGLWPEVLPPRIADRVIAALVRAGREVPKELLATPAPQPAAQEG